MVTDTPAVTGRRAGRRAPAAAVVAVRAVAVLLLVSSAVTGSQAAWSRFAVCFVGGDPPVDGLLEDGAGGCVALQDHLYDYNYPSDPWVPIADAAQREGVSLLALGLAVVLVSLSMADRRLISILGVAAGAASGVAWLAMAVPPLLSGIAGEPVTSDLPGAATALLLLLPLLTLGAAVLAWGRGTGGDGPLLALFWVAVTVAHPLVEFFATLTLWGSHDASPLTGFFRCAAVAVAAVAVAVTLVPPRRRPRLLRDPSA